MMNQSNKNNGIKQSRINSMLALINEKGSASYDEIYDHVRKGVTAKRFYSSDEERLRMFVFIQLGELVTKGMLVIDEYKLYTINGKARIPFSSSQLSA